MRRRGYHVREHARRKPKNPGAYLAGAGNPKKVKAPRVKPLVDPRGKYVNAGKPGQKHIISFSGGKDSAAMLFRMLELKMPIDMVLFADTGKEFPEMYDYINKVDRILRQKHGLKVTTIRSTKPHDTWDDWFYGKVTSGKMEGKVRGWPLTLFPCWWSRQAKANVLDPVCKGHQRYIGIAADEPRRINQKNVAQGFNYPLAQWGWTEPDCLKYLDKIGMSVPLHHHFSRTGCFCCPKQGMKSLVTLCRLYPKLWKELRRMDATASNDFKRGVNLDDIEKMAKSEVSTLSLRDEPWRCTGYEDD